MKSLDLRFSEFILNRRFWIILFNVLAITLLAIGAKNIYITSDYRVFFKSDDPRIVDLDTMQNDFGFSESILLLIEAKESDLIDRRTIAAIQAMTDQVLDLPYVIQAESISNYQHIFSKNDELTVTPLRDFIKASNDPISVKLRHFYAMNR